MNSEASQRGATLSLAFILGGGLAFADTAPAGGKELTDFGKGFKDNGFTLKN